MPPRDVGTIVGRGVWLGVNSLSRESPYSISLGSMGLAPYESQFSGRSIRRFAVSSKGEQSGRKPALDGALIWGKSFI